MFRGSNHIPLDAKGRMTIPAKIRSRLESHCEGQLVLTLDREALSLYPLPEWEELERKLAKLPSNNAKLRNFKRFMLGNAHEIEIDSAGRVNLPGKLLEKVGIDRKVVFAGQGNKFEIWAEDAWVAQHEAWLDEEGDTDLSDITELADLSW